MKKYIKIILGIGVVVGLSLTQLSCSDLLDQKPQGEWIEGQGGSFESDVFAVYTKARGFSVISGNGPLAIHNFRCEDIEKGSTSSDGSGYAEMYDDFSYNAKDGAVSSYWSANYTIIQDVNTIFHKMDESVAGGKALKEGDLISKGEAHFFRANAYFNLVRAFGEIPIYTIKYDDAAKANNPKSSVAQVYELIDADLTEAVKFLPKQWEQKFVGRLTWGAAKSLHARTYMMRNDWGNMHTHSTDVMSSLLYDLKTPFDKIFRETGENSSESVYELQCTAMESETDINKYGSQYSSIQGVRGSGDWNLGWGWHTPTQLLANAFETGDPRKDETLLYFARSNAEAATMTPNKPYNEVPVASSDVVNKFYNKKIYTDPAYRTKYSKGGSWVNIRVIRYADVVLMAAEAANELGNTGDAKKYLEMVRARARGTNSAVLPEVTTNDQVELRKAIRHERRIELAMEWDRFYDLVRWGTAQEVLHGAGKTGYQAKHALLPLPQDEIDKSNGVLIQNPNY